MATQLVSPGAKGIIMAACKQPQFSRRQGLFTSHNVSTGDNLSYLIGFATVVASSECQAIHTKFTMYSYVASQSSSDKNSKLHLLFQPLSCQH